MKKHKTLLIMAAGMGSRFGGLKQIEPVGPNGEFLIDYSIYDAIDAGFDKVVFVIKKENEEIFKETVGNRISQKIKVEYAFQDISNIPSQYLNGLSRTKPWGTAHAILCAKEKIKEPFIIINADDFYGRDAYQVASQFLDRQTSEYCLVGYQVVNTLSQYGSVKRAVCVAENGKLNDLIESSIIRENGNIVASPLNGDEPFSLQEDTLVSMNMIGFDSSLFQYLEMYLTHFLNENKNDLEKEYLIPDVLCKIMKEKKKDVALLSTSASWLGITYRDDKDGVISKINHLIEQGEYPKHLW